MSAKTEKKNKKNIVNKCFQIFHGETETKTETEKIIIIEIAEMSSVTRF